MLKDSNNYKVTRQACPRNCYDSCSILSYTEDGVLKKISGDPANSFTNGKLCAKGYSYINRVYSKQRLKNPLYQKVRGSGKWINISWDEAYTIIAEKILKLYDKYNSNLSICLNKYSGNFGLLHYAIEGFFNSIAPTTRVAGSPCWSAGLDANFIDYGGNVNLDPELMIHAKLIILWGVNPAWTSVHSMPFIYSAQEQGATVITIDPLYTASARKSDIYLQVETGKDLELTLAITRVLCDLDLVDHQSLQRHTSNYQQYIDELKKIKLDHLLVACGQDYTTIEKIAKLIIGNKPLLIWTGFGLQRHARGGQTIHAINALAVLTGSLDCLYSGVQYAQQKTWDFTWNIMNYQSSLTTAHHTSRFLNINNFADELTNTSEPPVKFLWLACRNLLNQSPEYDKMVAALTQLELIVCVEQFMTADALMADLVLPTTTQFEEWDIVYSYWHHWISINQPAIKPLYDCKSDLDIMQGLAQKLNSLRPGFSGFPTDKTVFDFIDEQFNQSMYQRLNINDWRELIDAPRKYMVPDLQQTKTIYAFQKNFYTDNSVINTSTEKESNKIALITNTYKYHLLTTHSQHGLNSQFQNLEWLQDVIKDSRFIIHPCTAKSESVRDESLIKVYNDNGIIYGKVFLSKDVPKNVVLFYQGWQPQHDLLINKIVSVCATDMGELTTGSKGLAFYDTLVNFEIVRS